MGTDHGLSAPNCFTEKSLRISKKNSTAAAVHVRSLKKLLKRFFFFVLILAVVILIQMSFYHDNSIGRVKEYQVIIEKMDAANLEPEFMVDPDYAAHKPGYLQYREHHLALHRKKLYTPVTEVYVLNPWINYQHYLPIVKEKVADLCLCVSNRCIDFIFEYLQNVNIYNKIVGIAILWFLLQFRYEVMWLFKSSFRLLYNLLRGMCKLAWWISDETTDSVDQVDHSRPYICDL